LVVDKGFFIVPGVTILGISGFVGSMGPFFIYTYCYDFEAIGLVEGIDERLKY
jgi:hypothetical protein